MSSYTKITLAEANSILELYGITGISTLEALNTGISNSNYLVTLEDKNKIILKISNNKSFEHLIEEQEILIVLSDSGYKSSVKPYLTTHGTMAYRFENYIGVVYPFVEGNITEITTESMNRLGSVLAGLHLHSEINFESFQKMRRLGETSFDFDRILHYINSEMVLEEYRDAFIDIFEQDDIEQYLTTNYPHGLLHGDLYYDNCLFLDSGKLSAVLDFEQAGLGDFIIDIGISISGSCLSDGKLKEELIESFLIGYNKVRPLNKDEKKLISFSICLGLFSIALWRIERFNINTLDMAKTDNFKELLERAYQYKRLLTLN
jgi:homoserine kinase type II